MRHRTPPENGSTARPGRHRRARWWLVVPIALAAVLVAAQLLATPIARRITAEKLANLNGYRGVVGDVRASVFPPSWRADRVKIIELGGDWDAPLLYAERVDVTLHWRALLRANIVARVEAVRPKISLVRRSEPQKKAKALPDLAQQLQDLAPLRINRIETIDGEALVSDTSRSPPSRLWLHEVDATVENLATREALSRGRPTTLEMRAKLQRSGAVFARIEAHPFEKLLTFEGRAQVRHLAAEDLAELARSRTDVQPVGGSLDIFAEFAARDGRLDGGVKTVAHDLELAPAEKDAMAQLKAWLGDAAVDVFSKNKPAGGQRLATVVPIKGTVLQPDMQLWPTLLGVVRNAFVQGISAGFDNVPPPTAEKKQGPLEQAADALQKGDRVKAQPQGRKGR